MVVGLGEVVDGIAGQETHHLADVFIRHHAEDNTRVAEAWHHRLQLLCYVLDTVRVMPRVADGERVLTHRLPTPAQPRQGADLGESGFKG